MLKNLTIKQISFIISFAVWVLHFFLIISIIYFTKTGFPKPLFMWFYGMVSLLIGYIIVRFLFETFVFRKIKLIWKLISESKASLKNVQGMRSSDITLDEVNLKVEEWAQATEKQILSLNSLEAYRKKYVGDISHELKTPIFTIQGYLHTLLEGGMYDEKVNRKYLERSITNLTRLQTIVEDLEMINQLESKAATFEFSNFDIKLLVEEVFRDLHMQSKEKGIELKFKQGANQSYEVKADRNKIEQVFINLINNSFKYGNENGTTKIGFYDMEDKILVEVSDDGIGISDEDLKHVFDRFYRADRSRSRKEGGSGLGLSIVKHIIEAHNHKITARSTVGLGSSFVFTLNKA